MAPSRPDLEVGRDVGPASMRRAATAMLGIGALASTLGIWTTDQEVGPRVVQAGLALAFASLGAWTATVRLGARAVEQVAMASMLLIGVLTAVGEPLSAAPFFLLWPVALIAYFSTGRRLVTACVIALVVLGAALWLHSPSPIKADMFMATAFSIGLLGWLIHSMTRYQAALRAELRQAAQTDPLTGLLNRRAFHPRFEAMIGAALGDGTALTLVMFDLDHFKRINDTHGHLAGDLVLEHAGRVLREVSRAEDLAVRLGGEEFAVALPGADAEAAEVFARRVAASLAHVPGIDERVSTCAGLCSLSAQAASTDALLRHADQALYAAKLAGRGRPALWEGRAVVRDPFGAQPGHDAPQPLVPGPGR